MCQNKKICQKTLQDGGKNKSSCANTSTLSHHVDILEKIPILRWFITRRWFQFLLVFPNLIVFYFFMIAGLFGTPVGNRNIIIVFVWIFWWFLLMAFMVPFGSRVWCTMCPFPFFGEWYQRRALIVSRVGKPGVGQNRMWGLRKKWPKALSNIWLQNMSFLALCTFSAIMLTRPIFTTLFLGGLIFIATVLHIVYKQRVFCNYVCPVSGFLGLYSMTGMLEVRSKDANVCEKCQDKECLVGNEKGWGCPWSIYPSKVERNNHCGLCMECIKTCPDDNMTLRVRPFCKDTKIENYGEAWKAFIMFSLAILYSVMFLGPSGVVKNWANVGETGDIKGFLIYTAILWFSTLIVMPSVWACASWFGKILSGDDSISTREIFIRYSYLLVPMGLMAWIAFSFPLIMVNGSYVISALSDPLGWGWDLFGTADFAWSPVFPEYAVYIQIPLLIFGLFYAFKQGFAIAGSLYQNKNQAMISLVPFGVLCMCFTIIFIRLFAG